MKSIYNEALDIVTEALYETDNSVIIKHTGLNELKKALEQAQKQEKLLELYKRFNNLYEGFLTKKLLSLNSSYYEIEIIKLKQQIKELENEKSKE